MRQTKSIFSSFLMVGLLGASLFAQSPSAGRFDATIRTSVAQKFADNQKFHNVKSSVEDGIVTLTGTVDLYQDKLDAAKAANAKLTPEEKKKKVPPKYPFTHALKDVNPITMRVHLRGNPKTLGEEAPLRFLEVVAPECMPFSKGSGRLELAEAIASTDNPLTARVMVNRIWQHHFGKGLVRTASNFGKLGQPA